MTSTHVAQRVQEIAAPILWAMGIELVEVVCVGQGPRTIVRVFIEKPGGVTLHDCEQVHLSLGPALDVADPIPHSYTLEVSSPGLDRPLKTVEDYHRLLGKLVNLKVSRPWEGQWRLIGRLVGVDEAGITLMLVRGKVEQTTRLAWDWIASGRLEVEF
ncbi:ribosome maturation factor RimP [Nitrospira sp.]|nr:ribosome maturation factor RimP [Nitrospira sp.]